MNRVQRIIGPCRCQGCGEPLWWSRIRQYGHAWLDSTGSRHLCPDYEQVAASRALLRALGRRLAAVQREAA